MKQIRIIIFILVCGLLYYAYRIIIAISANDPWIYTKSIVMNSEEIKGITKLTVNYAYKGKEYKRRFTSTSGLSDIGQQFFIQLSVNDPNLFVFEEASVPECLWKINPPDDGWKELPVCK